MIRGSSIASKWPTPIRMDEPGRFRDATLEMPASFTAPDQFSPTSVQFKSEISDAFPRKRHQKRHLEFCTAHLRSRVSGVRISPGAPSPPISFDPNELAKSTFIAVSCERSRTFCGSTAIHQTSKRERLSQKAEVLSANWATKKEKWRCCRDCGRWRRPWPSPGASVLRKLVLRF